MPISALPTHIHSHTVDELVSNEDVGADEDEEAWLDALESGDVNERGYLPAKKASTLTARQVCTSHAYTLWSFLDYIFIYRVSWVISRTFFQ